jgi:Fe-S-cluster containining protein
VAVDGSQRQRKGTVNELADEDELPACLSCGACCFSQMPTYVRVTGDDYARLGAQAERLVWFDGNRAYMRMRGGHCAALRVDLGVDEGAGRFTCTAYDVRPATCRDLGRGSPACLGERATKAARPREAIAHLLSKPRETNPEAAAKPETER